MQTPSIQQLTEDVHQPRAKQVLEFIFYGNYFYGICAVSIILETATQLKLHFDGFLIYLTAFITTILFYNYPYSRNYTARSNNPRILWYIRNHRFVVINQIVFTISLLFCLIWASVKYYQEIRNIDEVRWILLLVFPFAGALYYGANFLSRKHNLRQIGWLKPFIIGFVWAGMANIYPILYSDMIRSQHSEINLYKGLLFLKTFMFISMLAIMFDIKDYAADSSKQLNTLIVKLGLRKTIFFVIIPLTVLGLLTFISYALTHQFSILKMLLIMIPFILLIAVTRSFRKRRTLLYYLLVIDGLIIVKAFFGIVAMFV
jgi:4-hydroxybenzoate polyprenyltransferase